MLEGMARVLLVEDDASMAAGIVRGLRAAGFDVELATNGNDGARLALELGHDVIVLDLMLPGQSGFDVLAQLRERSFAAPVIVLTARTELDDRLRSFDLGAADFVAKPFWIEELVARIRSRLGARSAHPKRVVRFADAELDLDARTATVGGAAVSLTRNELDTLVYLAERQGRAITREQLAENALDPDGDRDARTVDTHVARLRKKLGTAAAACIVTVWGIGYRFEPGKAKP
jgi:DNA-binding response OmpR family regulator